MNNEPNLQNRVSLSRLLVLTLMAFFAFNSGPAKGTNGLWQESETELINNANKAVIKAQGALNNAASKKAEAAQRIDELKSFSAFQSADAAAISDMQRLVHTVALMFDETQAKSLQGQLQAAQTELQAAKTALTASQTALGSATSTPGIEAAKKVVKNKLDALEPALDPDGKTINEVNAALGKVYDAVKTLAEKADQNLAPLKAETQDGNELLNLYRQRLAGFSDSIRFNQDLRDKWESLSAVLAKVFSDHDAKAATVNAAITKLDASVAAVAGNLNMRVATLKAFAKTRDDDISATGQLFKSSPKEHEREAQQKIAEGVGLAAALDRINSTVSIISAQAADAALASFDKDKTKAAQDDLDAVLRHLSQTTAALQESLAGDASLWVTEKIRLYYFTDIPRLIKTLNQTATLRGGDETARSRASEQTQSLREAEDAMNEASGEVARLKQRKSVLERQLRKANDDLNLANILASTTKSKDAELNRRPAGDVSDERKARSLEEKNKREQERADAQARFDQLNDENNGIPAKLREAEARLEAAQADFERTSAQLIRAAQAESTAFAAARDNAPFWFAGATATSSDPVKRVEITSSTGGDNTIFIRGRKDDVFKVKEIVAKLDEPAPQARMTLWKLELNSDATIDGAKKFNESMEIIERELANTRGRIAAALSLLLDCINEEADRVANLPVSQPQPNWFRTDCEEIEMYREKFGNEPLPGLKDLAGRDQREKRYQLYSEQVQKELGVKFATFIGFDNPKTFGLKDPASATTLNEALIVLLLADRGYRQNILDKFESRLPARLNQVTIVTNKERKKKEEEPFVAHRTFARLYSMLNKDTASAGPTSTEMSRQQAELVHAIRGLLLKHLKRGILRLQSRLNDFNQLSQQVRVPGSREDRLYKCLQTKLPSILDTIHDEFGISPVDAMGGNVRIVPSDGDTIALQNFVNGKPDGLAQVFSLAASPARVAAADGMLDLFIKAFEDDIDREFIQPMLHNLRERLRSKGVGLGVIQRTSVLATNRLVARVDPRATAELAVGEETNLIQALQQISQLIVAGQSGNVPGVLGAFQAQTNQERPPEIFGITSGNAFQVTPIFDPTGQALRFKFDFVDTTLVREPNGTVDPKLPRIQRHTVNTEVQLGNLEVREVSRFESDSKIGLPTRYQGGLPLLKDIPGVRPIPVIGWFVRKAGKNAITQQSLIFAQTTMSPTIGDILDLLDVSLQRQ